MKSCSISNPLLYEYDEEKDSLTLLPVIIECDEDPGECTLIVECRTSKVFVREEVPFRKLPGNRLRTASKSLQIDTRYCPNKTVAFSFVREGSPFFSTKGIPLIT